MKSFLNDSVSDVVLLKYALHQLERNNGFYLEFLVKTEVQHIFVTFFSQTPCIRTYRLNEKKHRNYMCCLRLPKEAINFIWKE